MKPQRTHILTSRDGRKRREESSKDDRAKASRQLGSKPEKNSVKECKERVLREGNFVTYLCPLSEDFGFRYFKIFLI